MGMRLLFSVGVLVVLVTTSVSAQINTGSDIVFVVDSSDNISPANFQLVKDWLQSLVEYWTIGPDDFQVSVITYGNGTRLDFDLNDGDYLKVVKYIGDIKYRGGTADAFDGIQSALDTAFTKQHGARKGKAKIIIHVGSGTGSDTAAYQKVVQKAVSSGVRVYNMAVGKGTTDSNLKGSASTPDSRYILKSVDNEALGTVIEKLVHRVSNELPPSNGNLRQTNDCFLKADIGVALDGSNSVQTENFIQLQDFLNGFVASVPISKTEVQFGLLQYSSRTKLEFQLGKYNDRLSIMNEIQQMKLLKGGTLTNLAIKYLRQRLFKSRMGARNGVPKIGIVITDGHSPTIKKTIHEAAEARKQGITFFVVGIGRATKKDELKGIAGSEDNVLSLESFDDLESSVEDLISGICRLIAAATTTPSTMSTTNPTTMPIQSTTTSSAPPTTQNSLHKKCEDTVPNCSGFIHLNKGFCIRFEAMAKAKCAKSCKFCTSVEPPSLCINAWNNCTDYSPYHCLSFKGFFSERCAQFCGFCEPGAVTRGYYGKCLYKEKAYKTGEKWNDGCDYECVCIDGNSGKYECTNKCPVYYDVPPMCTFVKREGECCLQLVCDFKGSLSVNSLINKVLDDEGNDMCLFKGKMYGQGEMMESDCTQKCQCANASQGLIKCHKTCPTFDTKNLTPNCIMEKKPGTCCDQLKCNFNTTSGAFVGFGSLSGPGSTRKPHDPTAIQNCIDIDKTCSRFGKAVCVGSWAPYMTDKCPVYCGLCEKKFDKPDPKIEDKCFYQGKAYKTGEVWHPDCEHTCVCEDELYGYYRCSSNCPRYQNIPNGCTLTHNPSVCCPELVCTGNTMIIYSTTNIISVGGGGAIYQKGGNGKTIPVVPKVFYNGTVDSTSLGSTHPAIAGCLFDGRRLIQDELSAGSACGPICHCVDVSSGKLLCYERCPVYTKDNRCIMLNDTQRPCCQVPSCPRSVKVKIDFGIPKIFYSKVEMPDPSTLISNTSLHLRATTSPLTTETPTTKKWPKSVVPPPTFPPGYKIGKNDANCNFNKSGAYYKPGERWTVGCDFNCLCLGGQNGKYICIEMCRRFRCPAGVTCVSVRDSESQCCFLLKVVQNTLPPPTTSTTTVIPLTATIEYCTYQGTKHPQGSSWFLACKEKCTCYDALQGVISCSPRCPVYYNIPRNANCKNIVDPDDPCCTVPVCTIPGEETHNNHLIPAVLPGGEFLATAAPGASYCAYNGKSYKQDEEWSIGCDYLCRCVDQLKGQSECKSRCTRYDKSQLPPFCTLTTDPADTCCQTASCQIKIGNKYVISGKRIWSKIPAIYATLDPNAKSENVSRCYVNDNYYYQGNEWYENGCKRKCRCENAVINKWTCESRCPTITPQSGCVIVTDPQNVCCKKKVCPVAPELFHVKGHINPGLIPTLAPRVFYGGSVLPTPTPDSQGKIKHSSAGGCLYKGQMYKEGASWYDGCDWRCHCLNATRGDYKCTDRCSKFPERLPAQCRLLPIPGDSCCHELDCSQDRHQFIIPTSMPGVSFTPPPAVVPTLPNGQDIIPPIIPPKTCKDGNKVYTAGQTWYIGCDLKCVCEDAGIKRCESRCGLYVPPSGNVKCTLKPDPLDSSCCSVLDCHNQGSTKAPSTGPQILEPVAPPAIFTGYGRGPTHPPAVVDPSDPKPIAKSKCYYNGQEYVENEKWKVGCKFRCSCIDAALGKYTCVDMCPRYPNPPPGCFLTRDVANPCCMIPVCPENASNVTTASPPLQSKCFYKNMVYQQGEVWKDGCDFTCTCDDAATGKIRCNRMCKQYTNVDLSLCIWVTDPSNPCCRYPKCRPSTVVGSTPDPSNPQVPRPIALTGVIIGYRIDGHGAHLSTKKCEYKGNSYSTGDKWSDSPCGKLCECVDEEAGHYKCTDRCPSYRPEDFPFYCHLETDPHNKCCQHPVCGLKKFPGLLPSPHASPDPSGKGTVSNYCVYNHKVYLKGQKWNDGCDYTCKCVDTGNALATVCAGRCLKYDSIPAGCSLVPDPADAECCQVASCIPSTDSKGKLIINTTQTFVVPGIKGYKYGKFPVQGTKRVCVYKGKTYRTGQSWREGCKKQCTCMDQTKGLYKCDDLCPTYTLIPQQCTLQQDPNNLCCKKLTCDPNKIVKNPYLIKTEQPSGMTTVTTPTEDPNEPRPIPTAAIKPVPKPLPTLVPSVPLCTFKGAYFKQFEVFNLDCERKCRCEAPHLNEINCFNRCPIYSKTEDNCQLIVDPKDSCCRVKKCVNDAHAVAVVTPSPQDHGNTKKPEDIPVPLVIPGGVLVGQSKFQGKKGFCVYKGKQYKDNESWNDGCGVLCTCLDASTSKFQCNHRCSQISALPANCLMEKDSDNCCDIVKCYAPGLVSTQPPPPSIKGRPTFAPVSDGQFCTYKGHKVSVGQMYSDDQCGERCQCVDAVTNHMTCIPRCLEYTTKSSCQLVPDSRDPVCCEVPKCKVQDRENPYGVTGKYKAKAKPYPPSDKKDGCFIKHQKYMQGQSWQENCEICTCMDEKKHIYECTSLCPSYPELPAGCTFEYDPLNPCCPKPVCTTQVSENTTYCVYNGIPYKQGELIKTGDCSKILRCEDSASNSISEKDRCPKHTKSSQGCHLETSPTDSCCQIMVCKDPKSTNPLTVITFLPGKITGISTLKSHDGSLVKKRAGCFVNNKLYRQGETWTEDCSFICACIDAYNGRFTCVERCSPVPSIIPPTCHLVQDARDKCCNIISCVPPHLLIPSVVTATLAPGQTVHNVSYLKPPVKGVCLYNNEYYREHQTWYEGKCGSICTCEDAARSIVQCRDVCPKIVMSSNECVLIPDPQNPDCCKVEDCPVAPNALPPKADYFWPSVPPRVIYGKTVMTQSFVPHANGSYALQGCRYKGKIYKTNNRFDDGCNLRCVCLNDTSGEYKCEQRCPTILPRKECVLVKDPTDPCCQTLYCDFSHSKPFPGGIPSNVTLVHPIKKEVPNPYEVPGVPTSTGTHTTRAPSDPQTSSVGFCLYQGTRYLQGQTWNVRCEKTCTCVNVTNGLYACVNRCPSFGDHAPNCQLRTDPSDSCCLVQDCSPSVGSVFPVTPNPSQPSTRKPNISISRQEIIVRPGNPGFYIKVVTGSKPKTDNVHCILEDGTVYNQGSVWQSGNEHCTCIDASKNKIQCKQQCATYYFLPNSCRMVADPKNPPCLLAVCLKSDIVSPVPFTQAPPVPTIAIRPTEPTKGPKINNCVVDGHAYAMGSKWIDGCQRCECVNPVGNMYRCSRGCPIFTSLPTYCKLVTDPDDKCCQKPLCVKNGINLKPVYISLFNTSHSSIGNNRTDLVPIPTHHIVTGSGHPPNITVSVLLQYGGSDACFYKGHLYRPGEMWKDGCDFTCACELKSKGMWTCMKMCGNLPPQLPSYCQTEKVPGQCCETLTCGVPRIGYYIPKMTFYVVKPGQIPKAIPGFVTVTYIYTGRNPGIIHVPGHGYTVTWQQTFKIRDRCIRHNRAYSQGQKWNEGCDVLCECVDETTGYYRCANLCPSYHMPTPHCVMTVIPNQCCKRLICTDPETGLAYDPLLHPKSKEYIYGVLKPGFSGFRPGYIPDGVSNQFAGCYFNQQYFLQGQKWRSGCGQQCTCVDGQAHTIECHDTCYTYTNVPDACTVSRAGQCCQSLACPVIEGGDVVSPPKIHRPIFNISEGACLDTIDNCDSYSLSACGPQYANWAKQYCPRYCGLCYETSLLAPACEDVDANCENVGQQACDDPDSRLWMWKNCHKTCGYCDACVDVLDFCETMKTSYCHGAWGSWAKLMCAKTCNFCTVVKPTPLITEGHGQVPSGWRLLFKGVSGVPGDLYGIWSKLGSLSARITSAQDLTDTYPGHYKSFYADRFHECQFEKIRVAIYNDGVEKASITFNATDADKLGWFDEKRIESSTWTDLPGSSSVHFKPQNKAMNLDFEVYNSSNTCAGRGWMFIATEDARCKLSDINSFHYSSHAGPSSYNAMEKGDVFAILSQGGVCNTSDPLPLHCVMKDHVYLNGEEWNDGCTQKCRCSLVNQLATVSCHSFNTAACSVGTGSVSKLRCKSYTYLPPGCRLVKKEGECCGTLVGETCHGNNKCWDRDFNITRAVGQKWRVNCRKCECQHTSRGYVTLCIDVCPAWNLGGTDCRAGTPRPGKCCALPICHGFRIPVPAKYKDEF